MTAAVAPIAAVIAVALAACLPDPKRSRPVVVYRDRATGYSVSSNQRYQRGIGVSTSGVIPMDGDRAEPGAINPAVIEHVFAAPEAPFARYYDLALALADKPADMIADLKALESSARGALPSGAAPRGRDYARALGRKLAAPINEALARPRQMYSGTAGVSWGIPVDLDARIPLLEYERDGATTMTCAVHRYQSLGVVLVRSSATHELFAWDVSALPGAFDATAVLDPATVAARVIALHASEP